MNRRVFFGTSLAPLVAGVVAAFDSGAKTIVLPPVSVAPEPLSFEIEDEPQRPSGFESRAQREARGQAIYGVRQRNMNRFRDRLYRLVQEVSERPNDSISRQKLNADAREIVGFARAHRMIRDYKVETGVILYEYSDDAFDIHRMVVVFTKQASVNFLVWSFGDAAFVSRYSRIWRNF